MSEDPSLVVDSPLLTVPVAGLRGVTGERKSIVNKVESIVKALEEKADNPKLSTADKLTLANKILDIIPQLSAKAKEVAAAEERHIEACKARLQHLMQIRPERPTENALQWNRARLDRLLVDHLLRQGHFKTARLLAQQSDCERLVDLHIFEEAAVVLEALRERDCGPALQWTRANQSRLNKMNSCLEFRLRLQEFVELVRRQAKDAAIKHAREHLSVGGKQHLEDVSRAFATLLYGPDCGIARYKHIFQDERWKDLQDFFMVDFLKIHNLTARSTLDIHLRAGLMSLKLPQSVEEEGVREDPMRLPTFRKLAEGLPFAKYQHSKLVCAISGKVMDEHNYPVVTPSGYVYSYEAVSDLAARNDGYFTCPVTGGSFRCEELAHAFLS